MAQQRTGQQRCGLHLGSNQSGLLRGTDTRQQVLLLADHVARHQAEVLRLGHEHRLAAHGQHFAFELVQRSFAALRHVLFALFGWQFGRARRCGIARNLELVVECVPALCIIVVWC